MKITQYELNDLFLKTPDKPLSTTEISVMLAIMSHYNSELGYAYPSTQKIMSLVNLSEKTIDRCRKSLIKGEWLTVEQGTGKGVNNRYYPNIQKIVDAAVASGLSYSGNKIPATPEIKHREQHKRNTSGLKQNKPAIDDGVPESLNFIYEECDYNAVNDSDSHPYYDNYDEDPDRPF